MNVPLFDEYDELPECFLTATPENLHRHVLRSVIIRLPGRTQPAVAVVLLLHGNEPVGLQAVQRLLYSYAARTLPRALTLVVGNVRAAALNQRHLDDQPDFNRIWPGTEQPGSPEGLCSSESSSACAKRACSLRSTCTTTRDGTRIMAASITLGATS